MYIFTVVTHIKVVCTVLYTPYSYEQLTHIHPEIDDYKLYYAQVRMSNVCVVYYVCVLCVHVCVCVHACMHAHVCMRVCMCVHTYTLVRMYVSVHYANSQIVYINCAYSLVIVQGIQLS